MPKTKIPVYFLTKDNEIQCQYITPLELYKIYHCQKSDDNSKFTHYFMATNNLSTDYIISYDLDRVKKRCNDKNIKVHSKLIQDEHMDTTKLDGRSDLLTDNSKTLYRCIDIYGNIVEVFVPNNKINDKKYWIKQAQQYKLLCDSDYLPFRYSSEGEGLKKVKKEIAKKICRKTIAYCFYDTEIEDGYYKCYGIKFPVEEKEGDLKTIKDESLKVVENDFLKVKIYHKEEIKKELKSNGFFHETSFKIGDTEIDLTPSKEKIDELNSLPECSVDIACSPNKENPKTEVIALIDSNKVKDRSAITSNDFVARITINRDKISENYGKVMKVELGINKDTGKEYTAEEARKLLLVNCTREKKGLQKNYFHAYLDLVLSKPEYYKSEDCSVRLPYYLTTMERYGVGNELEPPLRLCTDKLLSNGSSMIIPMGITNLDLTSHMFVIVATREKDKISFKIFDPSTALRLENKEKLEQQFGNYIYSHLDKEYILSPKERIQNALAERNPLFRPTCTGISTEYINYIIDKKQDKNPEKLTAKQGKEIQERYAKHVVENGLHHIILGEQQIEPSILLYNNETLKLVKCSDYEKNPKNYGGYQVICTTNGQEFIITSDKNKFNDDIPGIEQGTVKNGEDKDNYVIFPVYVNNRKLYLTIYEDGVTFLMDTKLPENRPVVLTDFDTGLLFNAASNSIPENSSNTPNDRILLYNNERLKLVKCSDYEKKLKNDEKYHVVCTKDGEKFIIPSNKGKFNNNIPEITNGTVKNGEDKDNYAKFPVLVDNKEFDLFIYEEGITFLIDKENSHKKYYGPVDLTGFDTSPLFKTPSNSIPENSSNKSSETVAKSEETKKEVQQVVEESQTTTQAKNTLQEKTATVETKAFQETRQFKQDEVVDKKEVKPEAVSVAVNDTDKKLIKEEITVRNAPVETPKQYLIKTEFVDGKLNMSLIEYKAEEHKKDFVKFCNDNNILFTKGADGYGCLFTEERAQDIIMVVYLLKKEHKI